MKRKPARHAFAEAGRFIHHVLWQYPIREQSMAHPVKEHQLRMEYKLYCSLGAGSHALPSNLRAIYVTDQMIRKEGYRLKIALPKELLARN
jgi:hypothetical protein